MAREVRVEKTAKGGVKSVIFYLDDQGQECKKDEAFHILIQELDEQDEVIWETFGFATKVSKTKYVAMIL
jgi:hypothetical protein